MINHGFGLMRVKDIGLRHPTTKQVSLVPGMCSRHATLHAMLIERPLFPDGLYVESDTLNPLNP